MPVSAAFAESNRSQRERLRALVERMDPDMLAVSLPNGWTVAGALAHVAFWDRQRLCMMRRWAAGDMCSEVRHGCADKYHGDIYNDAVQPLLELIPPEQAAAAAVRAAEEVDAFLQEVSDEVVEKTLARPDAPNLDRGSHRVHHLDAIERALAKAGYGERLR
jgi:DinB family protein